MDFGRFQALSFDCYGTLIDWESGITAALRPILHSHGVAVEPTCLLEAYGKVETEIEAGPYRPYRQVLREVLHRLGDAFGFTASAAELESFAASVKDWPAFHDSAAALHGLAKRYRLIVLSNIDEDLFGFSQRALSVEFDRVFTAQRIGSYKPSRRNFEYLIEHSGVPRERMLHVAQSLYHDIGPAKELSLATVWVDRRKGLPGPGATPPAPAVPDLTVSSLRSLAVLADCWRSAKTVGRVL